MPEGIKSYIGTKVIKAVPMDGEAASHLLERELDLSKAETANGDDLTIHPGYLVEYEDGYQSWSPAKPFEKAYRPLYQAVESKPELSELLAEAVHKAYCADYEAKNGEPYWTKGDYSLLKESAKDTDMSTVTAVLSVINAIPSETGPGPDSRRHLPKTLHNLDAYGAKKNVKDIKFFGDRDQFQLLSKASSEAEGWMKSTKAMDVGNGCVVQVTTQQGDNITEALTFVPGVTIAGDEKNGRRLVESCNVKYNPSDSVDYHEPDDSTPSNV
jgi:hypothetical protein